MQARTKKITGLIGIIVLSIMLTQCRQSSRGTEIRNAGPIDNATAETVFNEIFKTVHSLAWDNELLNGIQDSVVSNATESCVDSVIYGYSTITFPNTIVIDYGLSSSCDGNYSKAGKVKVVFSDEYGASGSVATVTFSGFRMDSLAISGTLNISNNGFNSDSNLVFNIAVANAEIESDSVNLSWNCSRRYEWISGDNTDNISDDKFEISGAASGRTSDGNEFDVDIISNLKYSMDCQWISEGIVEMNLGSILAPRTIDYGSGSCDEEAVVTYKSTSYDLEMR
jgi:hypothetical protein